MSLPKVLPRVVQLRPGLGTTTMLPSLAQSLLRADLSSPSRCLALSLVTMTFDHLEIGSGKSGSCSAALQAGICSGLLACV